MNIAGKLVGALLGWMLLRNPVGLFIGFVLGHLWDQGTTRRAQSSPPDAFIGPLFGLAGAIAKLRDWCRGRRDRAYILLDLLLELVFAEGSLAPEKFAIVRRLCASLGVHEQDLAALAAMRGYGFGHTGGGYRQSQQPPGAPPGKDPYAVLGLSRDASDREVKTAYRRLIGQHHPDKLGDVPEELKRRAEERAREINIAYEKIRAERGFT